MILRKQKDVLKQQQIILREKQKAEEKFKAKEKNEADLLQKQQADLLQKQEALEKQQADLLQKQQTDLLKKQQSEEKLQADLLQKQQAEEKQEAIILLEQIKQHEEETKLILRKQQDENLKQMQQHAEKSLLNLENENKNQQKEDVSKLNVKAKIKNKKSIEVSEKKKRKVTSLPNEEINLSTLANKSPKKLTAKEARLMKQPRAQKVYRPPKNRDYYSDASGELVDDDISIDSLTDLWKGTFVSRKKQKLKENQKDEWMKHSFCKSQQSTFAMKLIKKEYVDKLDRLQLKRKECRDDLNVAYEEQTKNIKSERKINEKTNKVDLLKKKM